LIKSIFPQDFEPDFVTVQPHRDGGRSRWHQTAGQLGRKTLPLAFARSHVIASQRDRS